MMIKNVELFEKRWNTFVPDLRAHNNTVNSWYSLWEIPGNILFFFSIITYSSARHGDDR